MDSMGVITSRIWAMIRRHEPECKNDLYTTQGASITFE